MNLTTEFIQAETRMLDNRFDMAKDCYSTATEVCTQDKFEACLDSPATARNVEKSREIFGDWSPETSEEDYHRMKNEASPYKTRLSVLVPHAAFNGQARKNEFGESSPQVSMDIDGLGKTAMAALVKQIMERKDELRISLGFYTASGIGIKLISQKPDCLNHEQAQAWLGKELGLDNYDHTHDLARCVFITRREDLFLYEPGKLFAPQVEPFVVEGLRPEDYPTTKTGKGGKKKSGKKSGAVSADDAKVGEGDAANEDVGGGMACRVDLDEQYLTAAYDPELEFSQGLLYHHIFEEFVKLYWGGSKPAEAAGWRHQTLLAWANEIPYLCDFNAVKVKRVTPLLGKSESEVNNIIRDAMRYMQDSIKPSLPYRIRKALENAKKSVRILSTGGTKDCPPCMPEKLPAVLRLICSKAPRRYWPAICESVFTTFSAYLSDVKFVYWDGVEHESTFSCVVVGNQSTGKSATKKPNAVLMQRIEERDKPNRQKEALWKQGMLEVALPDDGKKGRKKKGERAPRPKDICVQALGDDLTSAIFSQRVFDAEENGHKYLRLEVDEADGLLKITSHGSQQELYLIIRKAFDNSSHGQERFGPESVTGKAPLRFVFLASTTPSNNWKLFRKGVNDGTVSRLNYVFVADDPDDEPVFRKYDEKYAQDLDPYLDLLEVAKGEIQCKKALQLALAMKNEAKMNACLCDSEAYRILSRRALVIAYIKSMVLYILSGRKWSPQIEDYVRWSFQSDMWCKMRFFCEELEEDMKKDERSQHSSPKDLLSLLGDPFSREDYRQLRVMRGMKPDDECATLRQWKSRDLVEVDEHEGLYYKTERYRKLHGTM